MHRFLISAAISAVLVASLALVGTPRAQAQLASAPASAGIPQLMSGAQVDAYLTQAQFHGYILLERHGHIILSKGYGMADVEHKIPNTIHTRWPIFSIESFMVAIVVLKLLEEGKLHVQDKICGYIAGCPDDWRPLTIRNLLTGTSGIPDYDSPYFQPASTSDAISGCQSAPLNANAGAFTTEDFSCNFLLLSAIVAKAARQPFATVMRQQVFEPAGLTETSVVSSIPPNSAHGYNDGVATQTVYLGAYPTVYASVADLLRFDQAFLTGKIVSKAVRATVITPYVPATDFPGYAAYGTGMSKANRTMNEVVGQGSGGPDPSGLEVNNSFSPTDGTILIDVNNDAGYYTQDADNTFENLLARLLWAK